MNQSVSLLAPGGQVLPTARDAKIPDPASRNLAAAPFSSMLERAEYQAPPQKNPAGKTPRPRPARAGDSCEANAKAERRSPLREKNKHDVQPDDPSLAGACAVTGQPVKTDELVAVVCPPGAADGEETQPATTPASAAIPVGVALETTTSLPAGMVPVVAAEIKTAPRGAATGAIQKLHSPEGAVAAAGAVESLLSPTATPQVAEDLIKQLTPASAVSSMPVALTPTPTPASGDPTILKELTPGVASAVSLPDATVVNEQAPEAAATNARTAEFLSATSLEPDAPRQTLTLPALAEDFATVTAPPEEGRQVARAARRAWTETLENARGIGAAKMSETMKTAIKKEEIAGVAQQMLPGAAVGAVPALPTLPGEARRSSPGAVSSTEALSLAGKLATTPTRTDGAGVENLRDARAVSPLVRVSELISREVRMFKRAGDDLVEVVLTPDAKTQISLRLQWREGQVEVQARCDLGDYQSLSTQWQHLQTSLAQHGVRLSHLSERATTGFTEFFNNPSFAQSHGGERRPPTPTTNADPLAPNGAQPAKPAPAKSAVRGNRLFDSWA